MGGSEQMTFILVAKTALLIAALLFAVCSVGAKEQNIGWRCVVMSAVFTAALAALIAIKG